MGKSVAHYSCGLRPDNREDVLVPPQSAAVSFWAETIVMSQVRDVATVGSATLLSRLLGFIRDVTIAGLLGAGVFSDAFFAVLQISNFSVGCWGRAR